MLNNYFENGASVTRGLSRLQPRDSVLLSSSLRCDIDAGCDDRLRVRFLGTPRVCYRMQNVHAMLSSSSFHLLAYLLLDRGAQLRERVASTLWPDATDPEARANLRRHLHILTRALPKISEPWILVDAKSIAWNPRAPLWCDVEVFDRLSADEQTWAAAADMYADDLLASEDGEWICRLRERLRERQSALLGLLADRCCARGDIEGAAGYYRRICALDPFREDAFRALMLLRHACGDRAGVMHEYRDFVNRLRAELGVEPMPETIACYERVVRGLPPPRKFSQQCGVFGI